MWHFQSSLNLISILSASDVCECCIVLYKNPFCPMAIRCPSDEKYFWCEGAIRFKEPLPQQRVEMAQTKPEGWGL